MICHQGYRRNKERLILNFFWPDMSKTIQEYVDTSLASQKKTRAVIKDWVPISVVPRKSSNETPDVGLFMVVQTHNHLTALCPGLHG